MNRLLRAPIPRDIENAFGRPVRHENVRFIGNRRPDRVQVIPHFHVSPVKEHGRVGRSKDSQPVPDKRFMHKKPNRRIVCWLYQTFRNRRGMVARNEQFGLDFQAFKPIEERFRLQLIEPRLPHRRLIAAMDHQINIRNLKFRMSIVRVGDEPDFHETQSFYFVDAGFSKMC